ncbi:MAG TPA: PLP-dependent aminotransferase family protein [Luteimonas sp.]|nr:PLP-dependent aminotransferase family protein [Luteimonas sp.]
MYVQISGRGPLFVRLARGIRQAILEGRVRAGDALPASRTLAAQLGVSRATVVAAYDLLKADGVVSGSAGSGTRVRIDVNGGSAAAARFRPNWAETGFSRRASAAPWKSLARWMTPYDCRYDFQYARPVTAPPVMGAWMKSMQAAASRLQPMYTLAQGAHSLRSAISESLALRRGLLVPPDRIVVTSGTQQSLALLCQILLTEGDVVDMEEPGYVCARLIMAAHGAQVRLRPVDAEGLVPAAQGSPPARIVYATPAHQFPTGVVLSPARRNELLRQASQWNAWIFEDDYDNEFRTGEAPVRALKSDDRDDRVIYSGTFSKIMFPGFGMGFVALPDALMEAYLSAKILSDFGVPVLNQAAMAHFMETGGYERHLHRVTEEMDGRRRVLHARLQEADIGSADEYRHSRGMYSMVTCHGIGSDRIAAIIDKALRANVGIYNASIFFQSPPEELRLMLGYAGLFQRDIADAVRHLSGVLRGGSR